MKTAMKKSQVAPELLTNTIPAGARAIGSVTTEKFPLGAVLVQFKATGLYALVSAGAVNTCDQRVAREYVATLKADK